MDGPWQQGAVSQFMEHVDKVDVISCVMSAFFLKFMFVCAEIVFSLLPDQSFCS